MSKRICIFLIFFSAAMNSFADRIYIMNSFGYNTAGAELIAEITSNGHTITTNTGPFTLPPGFTSTCVDPVNGYDWLCFFGDNDFTPLIPQIQAFIDAGVGIFIIVGLSILLLRGYQQPQIQVLPAGSTAPVDIIAPEDLKVEDPAETERLRGACGGLHYSTLRVQVRMIAFTQAELLVKR